MINEEYKQSNFHVTFWRYSIKLEFNHIVSVDSKNTLSYLYFDWSR
jgi:hypothetical protein